MEFSGSGSSSFPSLPPPCLKLAPEYPDLFGKRREMARVQMLEREISILEEELKSAEGLQVASGCCKEVANYVLANSDPLIPRNQKKHGSCSFWKWLCSRYCVCCSRICCSRCSPNLKSRLSCSLFKWKCRCCPCSGCSSETSSSRSCCRRSCSFLAPSCLSMNCRCFPFCKL